MKKINILSLAVAAATLFSASSVFAAETAKPEAKAAEATVHATPAEEAKTEEVKAEEAKKEVK